MQSKEDRKLTQKVKEKRKTVHHFINKTIVYKTVLLAAISKEFRKTSNGVKMGSVLS